jgi:fibronectin-binding autotransporter adhesin
MRNAMSSLSKIVSLLTVTAAMICWASRPAYAGGAYYWILGGNGDWADGSNWQGGAAPPASDWDQPTFGSNITAPIATTSNTEFSFDKIIVTTGSSDVSVSGTGLFRIGGGGIDMSSAAGNLTISNTLTAEGNNQWWNIAAGRTLALNGRVNGNNMGGDSRTVVKIGAGTLSLGGADDNDSFNLAVQEGTVLLNKTSDGGHHAVSSITKIDSGATVKLAGTGSGQIFYGGDVRLTGGTFELNGNGQNNTNLYVDTAGSKISESTGNGGYYNPYSTTLNANLEFSTQDKWVSFGGGVISGGGSLTKSGAGWLSLDNSANTYTGQTIVAGGHLCIKDDGSLGTAPGAYQADKLILRNGGILMNNVTNVVVGANRGITLDNGGGLQAGWDDSLTINSKITGTGGLTIAPDGGTVVLANTGNDYAGGTTIKGNLSVAAISDSGASNISSGAITFDGGKLQYTGANTAVTARSVTLAGDGRIDVSNAAGRLELNVGIAGNGKYLTKYGDGTLILSGDGDNVSLNLVAHQGTIELGKSVDGSHTAAWIKGIDPGAVVKLTGVGQKQVWEWGEVDLTGGTFELNGKTHNGANFYVNTDGSKISESTGAGSWFNPNSTTLNANLEVANGSGELHFNNKITGTGSITKTGNGELILDSSATTAEDANNYSGKTIVKGGRLRVGDDNALGAVPTSGPVADQLTLDGGILMNNDAAVVIAANRGVTLGAAGGGFQAGWGKSVTIDSKITGAGGLTVKYDSVPGAIYLANASNDYSGGTTVEQGGILALTSTGSLGGGKVTVDGVLDLTQKSGGYTLGSGQALAGSGRVNMASGQALTLQGGLAPGNSPGTLTLDGDLVLASGTSTFQVDGWNAGQYDLVQQGSEGKTVTFGGILDVIFGSGVGIGSVKIFDFSHYAPGSNFAGFTYSGLAGNEVASFNASNGYLTVALIPEPASIVMIVTGLIGLIAYAWRKRR